MKLHRNVIALSTTLSLTCAYTYTNAQDLAVPLVDDLESTQSADELARELANPNSSLASLTFKLQYRQFDGDIPDAGDQDSYNLLFQPVFPFSLGESASGGEATFFARPAIPYFFNQPTFDIDSGKFESVSGMGDIVADFAYGVTEKNGLLWAFGMVTTVPTATDSRLGSGKWSVGPEIFLGKFEEWGVYGIFPSHQWDVAGWGDRSVNVTTIQPFLQILPGDGWSVGSAPIINYDWNDNQWSIPLQLQVAKTIKMGDTPVKLTFEANYYVESSDTFGQDWFIGFNFTPVVENFIENWIKGK
ncbi:hypothetical protein Rhal01_01031 [Rubritalea halochordaticola]|uniref:Transporter n=1 Tax=Rubritalea halochordaticola TaxID=714537 RepID=A0ABP9V0N6_9BACT